MRLVSGQSYLNLSKELKVGQNVVVNATSLFVGNSTVNTSITATQITNDVGQFGVALYVGDNVDITTTGFSIGNSTTNVVSNSSQIILTNFDPVYNYTSRLNINATAISCNTGDAVFINNPLMVNCNNSGFSFYDLVANGVMRSSGIDLAKVNVGYVSLSSNNTGGSIPANTYYFMVRWIGTYSETGMTNQMGIATTSDESTITVTFNKPQNWNNGLQLWVTTQYGNYASPYGRVKYLNYSDFVNDVYEFTFDSLAYFSINVGDENSPATPKPNDNWTGSLTCAADDSSYIQYASQGIRRSSLVNFPDPENFLIDKYGATFGENAYLTIGNSSINAIVNSSILQLSNSSANIVFSIPTTNSNTYFLSADGQWHEVTAVTNVVTGASGNNTQIQFNDGGYFGANSLFTYNKDTSTLSIGSNVTINTSAVFVGNSTVNSSITATQITNDVGQFEVALYVGSNVDILTTGLYVGNSSVNSVITSSASHFTGNVAIGSTDTSNYTLCVNGSFAATTKSFLIPHPTKPKMMLRYGSLEGPENGVYVRGRVQSNRIDLPDYWKGLIDEDTITVNLTPIGNTKMPSVEEVKGNRVYLKNGFMRKIDCYFIVFAERKDVAKLEVEF